MVQLEVKITLIPFAIVKQSNDSLILFTDIN